MTRSDLSDAFAHHVWATLRLLDVCQELGPEQLETAVPGTYGSILDTMRHLVAADERDAPSGEVGTVGRLRLLHGAARTPPCAYRRHPTLGGQAGREEGGAMSTTLP
jgi:hypothetical protein